MSFDDDARDKDYRAEPYFIRPAMTIVLSTFDGDEVETITVPEVRLTRGECSPAWLALEEAEKQSLGVTMTEDDKPDTEPNAPESPDPKWGELDPEPGWGELDPAARWGELTE